MKNKITVEGDVKSESGTSKNGKAFTERYQEGYLHVLGAKFPKSCRIPLYDNARPYPAGDFETDQDVEINDYGRLVVKRELVLHHVAPAAAAKA